MDITKDWIESYREKHKSRAKEVHLKGGLVKPRHPHMNLPYCNICDKDFKEGDESYRFYVGGHAVNYHIDCVLQNLDTSKIKNIISQDKGYREKNKIFEPRPKADEALQAQFFRYLFYLLSP